MMMRSKGVTNDLEVWVHLYAFLPTYTTIQLDSYLNPPLSIPPAEHIASTGIYHALSQPNVTLDMR